MRLFCLVGITVEKYEFKIVSRKHFVIGGKSRFKNGYHKVERQDKINQALQHVAPIPFAFRPFPGLYIWPL